MTQMNADGHREEKDHESISARQRSQRAIDSDADGCSMEVCLHSRSGQ